MFTLLDAVLLLSFVAFCALWWNAQGVKQMALHATKKYCQQMDVQLLDDGIVLRGFWAKRDKSGSLRLWRSYNFEFTATGYERYSGRVILLGNRIESIMLEPHRLN